MVKRHAANLNLISQIKNKKRRIWEGGVEEGVGGFFSLFAYILFMDLLGRWGMLLHQLQTLPYLTNQPFDVAEIRGSQHSACQTKMAAGAYVHECEISKRQ